MPLLGNKKNWWKTLSYDEQVEYLKRHPASKRKVTKKRDKQIIKVNGRETSLEITREASRIKAQNRKKEKGKDVKSNLEDKGKEGDEESQRKDRDQKDEVQVRRVMKDEKLDVWGNPIAKDKEDSNDKKEETKDEGDDLLRADADIYKENTQTGTGRTDDNNTTNKPSVQKTDPKNFIVHKPSQSLIRRSLTYLKNNPGKVALAAAGLILTMRSNQAKMVDGMPVVQRNRMADGLRTAVRMKDSKALKEMSVRLGIQTGVLFFGAVALSVFTGVDMSFAIPVIASTFWENIKESPDNVEYLKNAGKAYVDEFEAGIEDGARMEMAVALNDADVVLDDQPDKASPSELKTIATVSQKETAKMMFPIMSAHESDLNKTLVKIEKLDIVSRLQHLQAETASPTQHVANMLNHIELIEEVIPPLASILVMATTQKPSLAERAKTQLSTFRSQHRLVRSKLIEIANGQKKKFKFSPIQSALKNQLSSDGYSSELAYASANGKIRLYEVHRYKNLVSGERTYPFVDIFARMLPDKDIEIAAVINSTFIPKSFQTISPRNLKQWLATNNLVS